MMSPGVIAIAVVWSIIAFLSVKGSLVVRPAFCADGKTVKVNTPEYKACVTRQSRKQVLSAMLRYGLPTALGVPALLYAGATGALELSVLQTLGVFGVALLAYVVGLATGLVGFPELL